jgi:D-ribose pyranose/furanose isomerase RbsD
MKTKLTILLTFLTILNTAVFAADNWKERLRQQLPLLGHRNWIVVADAAYPLQTAPGIETVYVDAGQLEVVKGVIAELAKTKHVKPTIYTDAEMKFVAETNAPGITAYRNGLAKVLTNQPVQVLPHEQIIAKLDEAGKTFKVLLIKTPLTKPYTSVFFQLECGYWNAESERQLREAMRGPN